MAHEVGIRQRARIAMGGGLTPTHNFAEGGGVRAGVVDVGKPVTLGSASPLTMARRNNGIPGMKKGGKVK